MSISSHQLQSEIQYKTVFDATNRNATEMIETHVVHESYSSKG